MITFQPIQQKPPPPANSIRNTLAIIGLVALAALAAMSSTPAWAEPGASDWVRGQLSKVRLIVGSFDGNAYHAGVEIRLKGNAHTYWRNPGDGGVPPVFSFAGSNNLSKTNVKFPAPTRSGKPGEQIIGYSNAVVFPLRVSPEQAAKQINLQLKLHYAACERICVPELANLKLTLSPKDNFPGHASSIARYEAAVPASFDSSNAPKLTFKPLQVGDGAKGRIWRVGLKATDTKAEDIFIEAPELWYFVTKRGKDNSLQIKLVQKPKGAKSIPPVRLTLTSSKGPFTGAFTLP